MTYYKKCLACGKPFQKKHPNQRFCSEECKQTREKANVKFRKEYGIHGLSKSEKLRLQQKYLEIKGVNDYG
jgi:hypothetical protein